MGAALSPGPQGYSSRLHRAVSRNDVEMVQYLVSSKMDLDALEDGYTALHLAVHKRNRAMVDILLKAGCDIQAEGSLLPPLLAAVMYGYRDMVQMLISHPNCDRNVRATTQVGALHMAVKESPTNTRLMVFDILVSSGIDVNMRDEHGNTPLHRSAAHGHVAFVEKFLQLPDCDKDPENSKGQTPLHLAVQAGYHQMALLLIQHGGRIDGSEFCDSSPVAEAVLKGDVDMVELLCENNVDVNQVDKASRSLLHLSVLSYCNSRLIAQCLVKAGFTEINAKDEDQEAPLYLAASKGDPQSGLLEYMISQGADVNTTAKENRSPVYIASYFNREDSLKQLLEAQADVNLADSYNKTPVFVATYRNHHNIVEILLAHHADVNIIAKNGKSPLYVAVSYGNNSTAKALINGGANVDLCDKEGFAPLHMALKFPKLDIPMVSLLVASSCDTLNLDSFLDWLLTNNIITQNHVTGDKVLNDWMIYQKKNPKFLKYLCRTVIQNVLGGPYELASRVPLLPLPRQLQQFLRIRLL